MKKIIIILVIVGIIFVTGYYAKNINNQRNASSNELQETHKDDTLFDYRLVDNYTYIGMDISNMKEIISVKESDVKLEENKNKFNTYVASKTNAGYYICPDDLWEDYANYKISKYGGFYDENGYLHSNPSPEKELRSSDAKINTKLSSYGADIYVEDIIEIAESDEDIPYYGRYVGTNKEMSLYEIKTHARFSGKYEVIENTSINQVYCIVEFNQ